MELIIPLLLILLFVSVKFLNERPDSKGAGDKDPSAAPKPDAPPERVIPVPVPFTPVPEWESADTDDLDRGLFQYPETESKIRITDGARRPGARRMKLRDPVGKAGCSEPERTTRTDPLPIYVWKARLRKYARDMVAYRIRREQENEAGGTWTYTVYSTCPEAFHDETRWDNVEIRLTPERLSPGEEYSPYRLPDPTVSGLRELLAGKDYTVSAFLMSEKSLCSSQDILQISIELEDVTELPRWIWITRDEGEM